jgi:hypothetical protein
MAEEAPVLPQPMKPTGFSVHSANRASTAFFMTPGTEPLYSPVAKMKPS